MNKYLRRFFPLVLFFSVIVSVSGFDTTCYYTAVPWTTVAYDQVLHGVYYELDYCVTYPDEGQPGDLGGIPGDEFPDCTGNLTLDHTLSMGYGMGGASIQDPTKGRWGNTFRLQGNALGMSNGTYEMKAYLQGAGIINNVRLIDWEPRMAIDLVHVTRNLNIGNYNGSEELAWYIGARYLCNDGSTIEDEESGVVEMYRFGDYYRVNGSWSVPELVGVPEPKIRHEDCTSREFSYGGETEYEHQVGVGYSWSGINAQLGFVLKKKYTSGLKIQGPSGKWYTFSKVTRAG